MSVNQVEDEVKEKIKEIISKRKDLERKLAEKIDAVKKYAEEHGLNIKVEIPVTCLPGDDTISRYVKLFGKFDESFACSTNLRVSDDKEEIPKLQGECV